MQNWTKQPVFNMENFDRYIVVFPVVVFLFFSFFGVCKWVVIFLRVFIFVFLLILGRRGQKESVCDICPAFHCLSYYIPFCVCVCVYACVYVWERKWERLHGCVFVSV